MSDERGEGRRGRRDGVVVGARTGGGARARAGSLEEAGNNNMFLLNFPKGLTQVFICLMLINNKTHY